MHAVILGSKGGSKLSPRKAEASRRNGRLGGRPRAKYKRCNPGLGIFVRL